MSSLEEISRQIEGVAKQIEEVAKQIEEVAKQIGEVQTAITTWENNSVIMTNDFDFWKKRLEQLGDKEKQLGDKEKQLRDEKNNLQAKELLLLRQSGPVTAVGVGGDQNHDNLVQTLTQAVTQAATQAVTQAATQAVTQAVKNDVMKDVMKELKVIIGGVQAPINSTMRTQDPSVSPIGKENKSANEISDGENSAAKQHHNTQESDVSYLNKIFDPSTADATRFGLGESKEDREDLV